MSSTRTDNYLVVYLVRRKFILKKLKNIISPLDSYTAKAIDIMQNNLVYISANFCFSVSVITQLKT